jgi:signal transduction histidine kinase
VSVRGDDAERVRRLQRVTDAALSHLALEDLLAALLERTKEVLEVDTTAVLLFDESTQELVARAALGLEEEVERGVRIPIGKGFAGRVAASRAPVVLADVDHADVLNPLLREKGVKSMLGVPLVAEGAILGVLHVGSLTPREFTGDDIDFLQLVGDRAATAIEHARLYEAERAARLRLENLQQVTDAALAHLSLDALFGELLSRIRTILAADTCAVLMFDEETQELVARAAVGLEEEVEAGVRIPFGRGFAGRVAAERRPIVLDDVDHADVLNPILREKGIKSMLGVPLLVRDEVLGVLHVGTLQHRKFTQDDIVLLQLVADRVALAIARSHVHEEIVRLDEMRLNFVAVASHELRTPAAAIYGILATLRSRGDSLVDEQRHELSETLWEQSDRMRRLIEQLLDLSRLDARRVSVEPRLLLLRRLVDSVVDAVASGTDVEVRIDPELEAALDPLVIDRVVSNLLANALRHGETPVIVSGLRADRHIRIVVEDSGGGVAADVVPRLFDRFERTGDSGGSGLGLAIAKAYANAHGGDVIYDRGERGARFELVIPVRD